MSAQWRGRKRQEKERRDKGTRTGPCVPIADTAMFAGLVRQLIEHRGGGRAGVRSVASTLGLEERQVWRLMKARGLTPTGRLPTIQPRVVAGLRRALRAEGFDKELRQLDEAALVGRPARRRYRQYIRELERRLGVGPPQSHVAPWMKGLPPHTFTVRDASHPTVELTVRRLDVKYAEALDGFRDRHAGHEDGRVRYAIGRALAPLLGALGTPEWPVNGRDWSKTRGGRSWPQGIEVTAQELHAKGLLLPYLKASLAAEAILLRRVPALERAMEITRGRA